MTNGLERPINQKTWFKMKIEGCIDDERQFKTAKRSQGLLVAF